MVDDETLQLRATSCPPVVIADGRFGSIIDQAILEMNGLERAAEVTALQKPIIIVPPRTCFWGVKARK